MVHDIPPELADPTTDARTISVYSNYAGLLVAPEEFVIRFCQKSVEGRERPLETVRVYMSLAHAKRLVSAMARTLRDYEAVFGEIPVEPSLTEKGKEKL